MVFCAYVIPGTASRWLDALLWIGVLAAVVILAALIARQPGRAARTTLEGAIVLTVFVGVNVLLPARLRGDEGLAIAAKGVAAGCGAFVLLWTVRRLVGRANAAARRREIDELSSRF